MDDGVEGINILPGISLRQNYREKYQNRAFLTGTPVCRLW